jgi:hypothetical protein
MSASDIEAALLADRVWSFDGCGLRLDQPGSPSTDSTGRSSLMISDPRERGVGGPGS